MTEQLSLTDLMAPYDDVAVDVVDSTESNADVNLTFTNRELAENVCKTMNWESFDLFDKYDFEKVHAEGTPEECLAHAFVSFLRWRVFTLALQRGVGINEFSQRAAAYSEFWYIKLVSRWNESNPEAPQMKPWVN